MAVSLTERAELCRGAEPFLLSDGDDVHHAGNGIRPVQRRSASLQDFDAVDHVRRDRVDVDGRRNAAAAGAIHEAQAIDEHKRALRCQIAQIDFSRTRANAAAVWWIAEVAAVVDLGIEAAARAGQTLENIRD